MIEEILTEAFRRTVGRRKFTNLKREEESVGGQWEIKLKPQHTDETQKFWTFVLVPIQFTEIKRKSVAFEGQKVWCQSVWGGRHQDVSERGRFRSDG